MPGGSWFQDNSGLIVPLVLPVVGRFGSVGRLAAERFKHPAVPARPHPNGNQGWLGSREGVLQGTSQGVLIGNLDHQSVHAVAQAVASGATGLEAVAVTGARPSREDLAGIAAIGGVGVPVMIVDDAGALTETLSS